MMNDDGDDDNDDGDDDDGGGGDDVDGVHGSLTSMVVDLTESVEDKKEGARGEHGDDDLVVVVVVVDHS